MVLLARRIIKNGNSGGELHYPSNHYEDLNKVIRDMVGGEAEAAPQAENNSPPENAASNEK